MTKIKQRKWLITIVSYLLLWAIFITALIFWTRPSSSMLVTPFTQDEITDKETLTTQFMELTSIYQEGDQPVDQEMVIDHLGPPHETNRRRSAGGEYWRYSAFPNTEPLWLTLDFTDEDLLEQYHFQNEAHQTTYLEENLQEIGNEAVAMIEPAFTAGEQVMAKDIIALFDQPSSIQMTEETNTYAYRTNNTLVEHYTDVYVEIQENSANGNLETFSIRNYNHVMEMPAISEEDVADLMAAKNTTSAEVINYLGEDTYEILSYSMDVAENYEGDHQKMYEWRLEELAQNLTMTVEPDGKIKDIYLYVNDY